ncbi:MAG: DNA-binding transcriptional regulator [Pirellulales bacterium]
MGPETLRLSVEALAGWNGNGIIARINTVEEARVAKSLGLPIVNTSGALPRPILPLATVDNVAVGRIAAEHLLACGLKRFAYYGVRGVHYSQLRCDSFIEAVEAAGGTCSVLEVPSSFEADWLRGDADEDIQEWLETLRPPIGIFACNDYRARMVLEACERIGRKVPDEVAVLGVDNDELVCESSEPSLSSVSCNMELSGYAAAELLDKLMQSSSNSKCDVILTPPGAVVKRASTDTLAIDDPKAAAAVQFVRDNLSKQIGVAELSRSIDVSRRWVEQAFQRWLGCTPHEYITRMRVERAQMLLSSQLSLPLIEVAKRCGFPNAKRLRAIFQQATGMTPTEFRRQSIEEKRTR